MFRSLRDDFNLPRCLRYKALHVSCGKLKIDWLDNVRAVPGEIWWCDVYHARSDCFESWEISKVSNLLHIGLLLAYHPYHPMSISEIPWNMFFLLCLFSPVAYAGWNCANGWWNMDPTNSQFENGCYIDGWPAGQAPYQFSKIIVIDPLIEGHSCSTYIIICLVGLNICQYP